MENLKNANVIKSLSIFMIIIIISSCNLKDDSNVLNIENHDKQGIFDKVMGVVATLGADLASGVGGAVAGAKIGAVLGPKGAALGGVIGATIVGAGASYQTGKTVSKDWITFNPNMPQYPYNIFTQDSANEAGYRHNELLSILCQRNDLLNSDSTFNTLLMYNISIQYLIDNGFNNPSQYLPFNIYNYYMNRFSNITCMNDVITQVSSDTNLISSVKAYTNNCLTEMANSNGLDSARIIVNSYLNNIPSLNLNYNSYFQTSCGFYIGYYSGAYWNLNSSIF